MTNVEPVYTRENIGVAFQLNWAVTFFGKQELPNVKTNIDSLRSAWEAEGVRVLEHRMPSPKVIQFLVSTKPHVAPKSLLRALKGRLQNAIRGDVPKAFRRNYRLESVGSAKRDVVLNYVASQLDRHRMVDRRVVDRLESLQISHPGVDLSRMRCTAHGQFIYNLHVVLEHDGGWKGICPDFLETTRAMIPRICDRRDFLLAEAGLVADHLHFALGCKVDASPLDVALCFLNNLAHAHGNTAIYRFGAYAGTFGNFDLGALWSAQRLGEKTATGTRP